MNLLKNLITLSFLMITGLTQVYAQMAILCISPISKTAVVDEMSGAPREQWGKPLPTYSVQVDALQSSRSITKPQSNLNLQIPLENIRSRFMPMMYWKLRFIIPQQR